MDYLSYNNKNWQLDKPESSPEKIPEKPFWMVIKIGSNGMTKSDAMPTVHHESLAAAKAEAERLARQHPNHQRGFAVVHVDCIYKGVVDVMEVTWQTEKPTKKKSK